MTFQWVAVAAFLYGEIGILVVLCLPFISPLRWQKIFTFPLWSEMARFSSKTFLTVIGLLIIFFFDACREVRKYSAVHMNEATINVNTNAFAHIQMKLFRSQRNVYLSGFSLFLWLVLRRIIALLTQLAKEMTSHAAVEAQVNDATEAVKKYLAENESLREALSEKLKEPTETIADKLKKEIEHLKGELQETSTALRKANNQQATTKKRSQRIRGEYNRLMTACQQLQSRLK